MTKESDDAGGLDNRENNNGKNKNGEKEYSRNDVAGLNRFLYVHPSLHKEGATLNDIVFNYNLQEFSTRVSFLCGLEQGGKLTPEQALAGIMELWKGLKQMRRDFYPRKEPKDSDGIGAMPIKPEENTTPAEGEPVSDIADSPNSNRVPLNEAEISLCFYAFSNRVSIVCSLIAGGKIDPLMGYRIIKKRWRKLRKKLGFSRERFDHDA